MPVKLTIVGIFYSEEIDVVASGSFSVKEIMDLALKKPGGGKTPTFHYSYATVFKDDVKKGSYVDFIAAQQNEDFTSDDGQRQYVKGTYALSQTFTDFDVPTYTVWQYYIFDEHGAPVSPGGEIPFDERKIVKDKFKIVWRLVSICSQPVIINPRVKKLIS